MKEFILSLLIIPLSFSLIIAQPWQNKIDDRLVHHEGINESFEFLVQFEAQADVLPSKFLTDKTAKGSFVMERLQEKARLSQANVISILNTKAVPFQDFWVANIIWVYGDYELVKIIAQYPEVKRISENSRMKMLEPVEIHPNNLDKALEIPWGIKQMNVDKVWEMGIKGKGVVVGGQDTGYEWEHESLKAKYRGWDGTTADHNYNWHDAIREFDPKHPLEENPCGLDSDVPCDDHNHGTHTMGTMVGEVGDLKIGVAPDATWIGCRNMERGWGTPQSYLECFEWFLAPTDLNGENADPSKAPHVINNSWGCPDIEGCNSENFDIMETAVNNLKAAGIVVVVSAGNSGAACATISTPAAIFENSFTIAALGENDTIAAFSSRGLVMVDSSNRMKPNVTAPGVNVKSAIRGNGYSNYSGTSMAGPHVAGLVALLISADPTLAGDVERIETIIEQTANKRTAAQDCGTGLGALVPNAVYGYGTVDALAVVTEAVENQNRMDNTEFILYPNPTNGVFTIHYIGFNETVDFQLFATDGKKVMSQTINFEGGNKLRDIDISNLTKGMYFYRMCRANGDCLDGRLMLF